MGASSAKSGTPPSVVFFVHPPTFAAASSRWDKRCLEYIAEPTDEARDQLLLSADPFSIDQSYAYQVRAINVQGRLGVPRTTSHTYTPLGV